MANLPVLRSKEQILGDLIDGFLARVDQVNDLSRQSVLAQFLESVAQVDFRAYAAIISMLDATSIDRSVGEALQRIAKDKNVPIQSGKEASGKVIITDTGFQKISSAVFAGQPAPVAGTQKLYVADASKFSSTGSVYIGRKTPNVEGPLRYTSVQPEGGGAYWSITLDPTFLTTKFHNIGEEVVQAQGGKRIVDAGTVVQTPQGTATTSISFKTTSIAMILDGETFIDNVPVVCLEKGPKGNIPKGAIKEAVGLNFPASVTNPNPFSNGIAADTDDTLRERIKAFEQAKSKGTETAIQVSSLNVVAPDELKKVISSAIVRYADSSAAVVFDDGTGYEPIFTGVGIEQIVDEALGGEKELQLRKKPISQARIVNNTSGPYQMPDSYSLAVRIKDDTRIHFFSSSDFKVPSSATPTEVADSINSNPNIHFYASTTENTTKLTIFPRDRKENDIQVLSQTIADANAILEFPVNKEYTARFYKNDKPLFQDGIIPSVNTRLKSLWAVNIQGPTESLQYSVDGSPSLTVVLTDADFQAVQSGAVLSAQTEISIWATVLTTKMLGVTVSVNGETLNFASNLAANNRASISILGGTLRDKIFTVGESLVSQGQQSDYILNRQTGQLSLTVPLLKGESLTAGSPFTRAKVVTSSIPNGPASNGNIWLTLDGDAKTVPSSIRPNTKITFLNLGIDKLKIIGTSSVLLPEGFDLVETGDWMLIWTESTDAVNYPTLYNHRGYWRVESVKQGEIIVTVADSSGFVNGSENQIPTDRIQFIRTKAPLHNLSWYPMSLSSFADFIPLAVDGLGAEVLGSKIRLYTRSSDTLGEIVILSADQGGRGIGLAATDKIQNLTSHLGFSVTSDSEASIPLFTHGEITSAINESNAVIADERDLGAEIGKFIEILNRYDGDVELIDSNKTRRVFAQSIDDVLQSIQFKTPSYMRGQSRVKSNDRFFFRNSYAFDTKDTITMIVDGDNATKSYTVPVGRKLITSSRSTPSLQDFSATDAESSLDLNDAASFYDFDFKAFKAWRKSSVYLTTPDYNLKVWSNDFGPSGDALNVGFTYPKAISNIEIVVSSDKNNIEIQLPVKTSRVPNWGPTTAFTVSKITTGSKDTVTYTYRVGDVPDFSASGSNITYGDVAIIDENSDLLPANKGIQGKVVSVGPTSFSIEIPTGTAENDELFCTNISNQNKVVTVTTNANHNMQTGDRIGLYQTALLSPLVAPFDAVSYVTVTSPTTFKFNAPAGVPGGGITSAVHSAGIVTVTSTAHGLSAGNMVLISGAPILSYNGLYPVYAVLNANQFQYAVAGSSASIASGRFDFQSYSTGTASAAISNFTLISGVLTATTSAAHGFASGQIVDLSGLSFVAWSPFSYPFGSIVTSGAYTYQVITGTGVPPADAGTPPASSPHWAIVSYSPNGRFVINSTPTSTSFTCSLPIFGSSGGGAGIAVGVIPSGRIARAIASTAFLGFADAHATAQEIADKINVTYGAFISATNLGGATDEVRYSTQDDDIATGYYNGTITAIRTVMGSNIVYLTTTTDMKEGAEIKANGKTYQLFLKKQVGADYIYSAFDTETNQISATNSVLWSFIGTCPRRFMRDGENFILQNDLNSLIGIPQFTCAYAWRTAPAVGEEIMLIAQSADHLERFWNKLVVTGLSNSAFIDRTEYGRQLQVMSKIFGTDGSIQVAGGLANGTTIGITGSAFESDKWGHFVIPYEARFGINAGQWININQSVTQNKSIGLASDTVLRVHNDGLEIVSGSGTFQTEIATTVAADAVIKVERHGGFTALIGIDGPALGLLNVKEGNRIKIGKYKDHSTWSVIQTYAVGDKVFYDGYSWLALVVNTGVVPTSGTTWKRLGFNSSNEGIFPVVRVFGNTVWIENENTVEEIATLDDASEIRVFTYDSIMPGDALVISGISLGTNNVGRYTVVDETYAPTGYFFPTATRIYTTLIPQASGGGVAVGDAFNQVGIEEKSPTRLWKRVVSVVPDFGQEAHVIVDTPNLMNKISVSLGANFGVKGKVEFPLTVNLGVDSYRYYNGLLAELNRVIYGDAMNTGEYPGSRAAGTAIDIKPSVVKKIKIAVGVRTRTGLPFSEIRERVKSSIAGYVNTLGVGQQVSLSKAIEAASKVNGVISVVVTYPTYDAANDLIYIGPDQKAQVIDPSADINVSILGT